RAQGGEQHHAVVAPARAVVHLRHAGGVRVVDHVHGPVQPPGEERVSVGADPAAVDVRRGPHDPVVHHRRHRDADRAVVVDVVELVDDVGHDVGHGLRGRVVGGVDADAVVGEDTLVQVDGGTLDAAAADVDAEDVLAHAGVLPWWGGVRAERAGPAGQGRVRI